MKSQLPLRLDAQVDLRSAWDPLPRSIQEELVDMYAMLLANAVQATAQQNKERPHEQPVHD